MSTNPPANATKATKAVAGGGARVVATIFGGADLKDLFTQQGMHGILNWTNPVLSTFFFLFSNLCIYIIFYGNYSLVSVACYLAMAHLIATFLLCQVGQFMAKFQSEFVSHADFCVHQCCLSGCSSCVLQMLSSRRPSKSLSRKSMKNV